MKRTFTLEIEVTDGKPLWDEETMSKEDFDVKTTPHDVLPNDVEEEMMRWLCAQIEEKLSDMDEQFELEFEEYEFLTEDMERIGDAAKVIIYLKEGDKERQIYHSNPDVMPEVSQ